MINMIIMSSVYKYPSWYLIYVFNLYVMSHYRPSDENSFNVFASSEHVLLALTQVFSSCLIKAVIHAWLHNKSCSEFVLSYCKGSSALGTVLWYMTLACLCTFPHILLLRPQCETFKEQDIMPSGLSCTFGLVCAIGKIIVLMFIVCMNVYC